jgi:excisionase family DNA binding protein
VKEAAALLAVKASTLSRWAHSPQNTLAVLPPIEFVDDLPDELLPVTIAYLAALQTRAAARLVAEARIIRPRAPEPQQHARHVTQQEAASQTGLPVRTVRFLTRTRRVPSLKRGRHRLLLLADLDRYLERCRQQGVAIGMLRDVTSAHDRRGD